MNRVIVCVLLFSLPLLAQKQIKPKQAAPSISIGTVELHIGMTKDRVLASLASTANLQNLGQLGDSWAVFDKGDPEHQVGSLLFEKGVLIIASRDWTPKENSAAALGRSLNALMKKLTDEEGAVCWVASHATDGPDIENRDLDVFCGRKQASLKVTRYKGNDSVSLEEVIRADWPRKN